MLVQGLKVREKLCQPFSTDQKGLTFHVCLSQLDSKQCGLTLRTAPQVTIDLSHRFELPSGIHLYVRPEFIHGKRGGESWGYSVLDDDAVVVDADGRAAFHPQLPGKWKLCPLPS